MIRIPWIWIRHTGVRCWQVHCWEPKTVQQKVQLYKEPEPKTGQQNVQLYKEDNPLCPKQGIKMFNSICKTIHFAHLGILFIYDENHLASGPEQILANQWIGYIVQYIGTLKQQLRIHSILTEDQKNVKPVGGPLFRP